MGRVCANSAPYPLSTATYVHPERPFINNKIIIPINGLFGDYDIAVENFTYSFDAAAWPTWLLLDQGNERIVGLSDTPGTFTYEITVTDQCGESASKRIQFTYLTDSDPYVINEPETLVIKTNETFTHKLPPRIFYDTEKSVNPYTIYTNGIGHTTMMVTKQGYHYTDPTFDSFLQYDPYKYEFTGIGPEVNASTDYVYEVHGYDVNNNFVMTTFTITVVPNNVCNA